MPNCPVCGGVYATPAGKVVNPDYKTITVCPKCYLEKSRVKKCIDEKDIEGVKRIYETWKKNLDLRCKDDNAKPILVEGLFVGFASQKEIDEILLARKKQAEDYQQKISNFMMTSGYNFEGYRIIKYHKVISASIVLGMGLANEVDVSFSDATGGTINAAELDKAKEISHEKLAEVADKIGANAIIGIYFDYLTLGNNRTAVSTNGTAVTIEPINVNV